MTQPVNLRQVRKRKAREDKAKQAEINRVQFGTPKAQRDLEQAQRDKLANLLDGHRREEDN